MADFSAAAPTLEHLVDVAVQLQRDEGQDAAQLRRRDRDIGRRMSASGRRARVLEWLERVRDPGDSAGQRAQRARRWIAAVLVLAGLVLGWGAARIVFHYDGSRPVNVVEVLAVFVAIPLMLLVMTSIAMLPSEIRRRVPGLAALQDGLAVLSPGRLQTVVSRVLPASQREALAWGRGQAHQKLFGGTQRWGVLLGSQSFAVAFYLGAIGGCLYLVFFTDLAFGWSTTLDAKPAELHAMTRWLAAPWSAWFPEADPSPALVDATRYFRLGRGSLSGPARIDAVDPVSLGGWWPFCVACMVVYGLLPRLATWMIARRRFAVAIGIALDQLPGMADLRDRLDQPWVQTAADAPELPAEALAPAVTTARRGDPPRRCIVVNWSGLAINDTALCNQVERAFRLSPVSVLHAGGSRTLQQDRDAVAVIGAAHAESEVATVVSVRAWEPPILEFVDFATDLRVALGDAASIIVAPVAFDREGACIEPSQSDWIAWERRIAAVGDPWLSVRTLAGSD